MKIRFVQGTGLVSKAIIAQSKTAMPFTPSHVEAMTPDGQFFIGAHLQGGMIARPVGYDTGEVARFSGDYDREAFPDGLCDMLLDLGTARDEAFFAFMNKHIGEPYDWLSIGGFIIPEHMHLANHVICSAVITLALRDCGWLAWPVAAPAHLISPRDLLLMISARMKVPGI